MAAVVLQTIGGESIEVGDSRDLRMTFRDRNSRIQDPSTITASVIKPDGTETTYTKTDMVKVRDGVYTLTLTFDQADVWVGKVVAFGFDTKQFRIEVGADIA